MGLGTKVMFFVPDKICRNLHSSLANNLGLRLSRICPTVLGPSLGHVVSSGFYLRSVINATESFFR